MSDINLGLLSASQTHAGFVGTGDLDDLYQFSLSTPGSFSLTLDGTIAETEVQLLDSTGKLFYSGKALGMFPEAISFDSLAAGDYQIQVVSTGGDTDYTLSLTVGDAGKTGDTLGPVDPLTGMISDELNSPALEIPAPVVELANSPIPETANQPAPTPDALSGDSQPVSPDEGTDSKSNVRAAGFEPVELSSPASQNELANSAIPETAKEPAPTPDNQSGNSQSISPNSGDSSTPSQSALTAETQTAAPSTQLTSSPAAAQPPAFVNPFDSGTFTVGETGEVGIDYLFDGGFYQGQLAVFSLTGMEGYEPGSQEFIKEVARRALSNSEQGHVAISDPTEGARFSGVLGDANWNFGEYSGVKTFAMTPGDVFGVMLVPNATVQQVFDNPAIGGAKRPLFSMATANPGDGFNVGQIADINGTGTAFVLEDMRVDKWTDRDYNDIIFQVRGAIGTAELLDTVINPAKDWRGTDIGQALLAYIKPYDEILTSADDGAGIAGEQGADLEIPSEGVDNAPLADLETPVEVGQSQPIAELETPVESALPADPVAPVRDMSEPAAVVPVDIPATPVEPASVAPPADIPAIVDQPASVAPPADIPATPDSPVVEVPVGIPPTPAEPAVVAVDTTVSPDSPVVVVPVDIPPTPVEPAVVAVDTTVSSDSPVVVVPVDIPPTPVEPATGTTSTTTSPDSPVVVVPVDIPPTPVEPAVVAVDTTVSPDSPVVVVPVDIPATPVEPASVAVDTTVSPDSPVVVVPVDIPPTPVEPAVVAVDTTVSSDSPVVVVPVDIPPTPVEPATGTTSTTTSPDSPVVVVPVDIPPTPVEPAVVAVDTTVSPDSPVVVVPVDIPATPVEPASVAVDTTVSPDSPVVVVPVDIPPTPVEPATGTTSTTTSPDSPVVVVPVDIPATPVEPFPVAVDTTASEDSPAVVVPVDIPATVVEPAVVAVDTTVSPDSPVVVVPVDIPATVVEPAVVAVDTTVSPDSPVVVVPVDIPPTPVEPAVVAVDTTVSPDSPVVVVPVDIPATVVEPAVVAVDTTVSPDSPVVVVPVDIPPTPVEPAVVAVDTTVSPDSPVVVVPVDIPATPVEPASVAVDTTVSPDSPVVVVPVDIPPTPVEPASVAVDTTVSPDSPVVVVPVDIPPTPVEPAVVAVDTTVSPDSPVVVVPVEIPAIPVEPAVVAVDTTVSPDSPVVEVPVEIPATPVEPAVVAVDTTVSSDSPPAVVPVEIPATPVEPAVVAVDTTVSSDSPPAVVPVEIPPTPVEPAAGTVDTTVSPDSPVVEVPVEIPATPVEPAVVAVDTTVSSDSPPAVVPVEIPATPVEPAVVAVDTTVSSDSPPAVVPVDIPPTPVEPAVVAVDTAVSSDSPPAVVPVEIPATPVEPAVVAADTTVSSDSPPAVVPVEIPATPVEPAVVAVDTTVSSDSPPAVVPVEIPPTPVEPAAGTVDTTVSPDSPVVEVPVNVNTTATPDESASVAPPAEIPAIVDQPASVAPPAEIPAIVDQPAIVTAVDTPASPAQPATVAATSTTTSPTEPATVAATSTNASPAQPATVAATSTTASPDSSVVGSAPENSASAQSSQGGTHPTAPTATNAAVAQPATATTSPTQPATVAATSTTASPTQPATVAATSTNASPAQPATVAATSTTASSTQPAIVAATSTTASPAQPAIGTPAVAKPTPTPMRFEFPVANQPLVGVISTGFTANNPDLNYSRIALGQDRVAGDANPLMLPAEGSAPGTHVLGIIGATQGNNKGIDGINDNAPLWAGRAPATSDKWAESLKEFVDAAKQSGQPNAIVNINLNLTETTPQGQVVPRSQLTAAEKEALAYAQQNKVLVVVAAGNDPQQISALGNAGLDFDNIITVGSGNRTGKTDYSGTGEALDIVAEGGTRSNPVLSTVGTSTGNMAGTSVAAAQVTGAVSQVWAANPQLNYRQVVDIVKNTATDLGQPNWDAQTGAGLLNMPAAVQLAKVTTPEPYVPNTQMPVDSPSGVFAVGETGKVAIDLLYNNSQTQGELAIFSLEGMEQLQPGSPAFVQEAARRALSGSELGHVVISGQLEGGRFSGDLGQEKAGAGEYQGVKTFDMRPGDKFAVMLVPNSSVRDVAPASSPASSPASPTVPVSPIFSIPQANPNAKEQIADLVGSGQTFGMQNATGSRAGGEFNDIIFRVDGATGKAPAIPTNVIGGNSWRETEVWHQITDRALSDDRTPAVAPVANFALTPEQPSRTIDLSQVFSDPEKGELRYEIVAGNSESLSVSLQDNRLNLTSLPSAGLTEVAIRATDAAGNSVTHTFSVTSSNLNQQAVATVNSALAGLQAALNQDPEDFIAGLESPEGEEALAQLAGTLEENPDLIQLLARPESLSQMGLSDTGIATLQQLLQSPDLAEEMGLPVTLGEALSQPDSTFLDGFLLNADEAADLLPADAQQPAIGFLDFSGGHGENVAQIFASVNPLASYDTLQVAGGNWAQQLVRFVDKVRAAGESHAIANLSFDLSQLDDIGDTTRYELTPAEQQAIQYARDNNVLLVVAAGNTGDKMSALGAAAQKFDNIITVGAVNQSEQRADYSGYGDGLSIMAAGGAWQDEPNAFVGTSKATPYVTAAASLVWAANPGLSYQQVKQLLLDTAADLNTPGWDPQTGAGLLDVKEAIRRAFLVEPDTSPESPLPFTPSAFSGEGRVRVLARPASEATEAAIAQLQNTQQDLFDQWQVLADLGNPDLTLAELQSEVGQKIAGAFDKYQQVSTDAAIATAQAQQWAEALALATSHYQIEQARLQELQARQKQLEEELAGLGQQKTALEAETQQLLDGIKQQIAQAESDLAKATAKLSNPFADVDDNLQTNSTPSRNAAAQQQQLAQTFQQQAWGFAAQQQNYAAVAAGINPNTWQVVGYQKSFSGRQKEIWGWGTNPNLVKQKNQLNWQAGIAAQNQQGLTQLAQQAQQQAATLNQYAQFLDDRKNSLDLGQANAGDAQRILAFLEQQAAQQGNIAQQYSQQAAVAEQRRQSNQDTANWHNSQINRWQVVGSQRKGSGKREDVYGSVHYPEHIAPRNQAQQAANQAAYERTVYDQLAGAAQQQAIALWQQVEKLRVRLRDWPVLKQGIDYEIAADALRLQAEKDLLAMHEPVQEQKLETLNLQISQAQSELETLSAEKLPAQEQLAGAAEQRLQETQAEVRAIQEERAAKAGDLQNFLETAGFLLPYRERLAVVQKNIEQLEDERLQVQFTMQEIVSQLAKTPSDTLRQQLNQWSGYLDTLEQELAWANLQKDQLALAVADSPERLAISALIAELEKAKVAGAGGTPVLQEAQHYINFLRGIEGSGANFLEGFDNLTERLAAANTEQAQTEAALYALKDEYVKLGLKKADLEDNQIPAKEKAIADKEREITGTQGAIAQTQTTLAALQEELPSVVEMQSIASQSLAQREQVLAATQSQLAGIQNQSAGTQSQIQQQQAVLQGYQNQIANANAAVNWWEQQRQQHQANANWWNGQISTWGITGYDWKGRPQYGWVYNPQAEANRNAEQAAANNAAWQRDVASQQAQQLSASLQPQIAATQQQIATLQQQLQSLTQQQQALQNQVSAERQDVASARQQLQALNQQVNSLQSQIQQQQQNLDGLNAQLQTQQQQRDTLNSELANLKEQVPVLDQQLIDKYRQIELTDKYLSQVEGEINRLDSRLDLLNRAGILEQQYQDNWQQWQSAAQEQAAATQALLATREAGAPARQQLESLQSQLSQAQANLDKANTLQQSIADTQQALSFTQLQLGNQRLQLQRLIDRDGPLAAAERYYLSEAEQHRQKMWYWNGSSYVYNAGEAAAYRSYLQQASFIADQRNQLWQQRRQTEKTIGELQQKAAQQQAQIASLQAQLGALGSIPQLQAQVAGLQANINTVAKALEPLQQQESRQTQAMQAATAKAQNSATGAAQTAELQAEALRQLIGFGMLASESDVDFFATEVEPKVNSYLEKLQQRIDSLAQTRSIASAQQASWEQQLANTTDPVSKQALTNLINQSKAQVDSLEALKDVETEHLASLQDLLNQARASLTPLRQKQELEIRQKLESNEGRLQALESLLNSENAAEAVENTGTVLAHAQLADQIRQDLTDNVSSWTEQLLEGHQMTKDLGSRQQNLSQSVDQLIAYIEGNFADPHGDYNSSEADLRDGITTLGVVENRADDLDTAFTSTEDAIERIKLRLAQDAALWEEIAPIAIRYGVESQELKDYLQTPGDEKTRRAAFLAKYPDNGTAIGLLQAATAAGRNPDWQISQQLNTSQADVLLNAEAVEGRNPLQALFNKANAEQASHEAQGHAALAQAAWYEQRAAYHWAVSRKNGPTWTEWRRVCKRRFLRRKKCWDEAVTHVDHDWIIWQQYSQIFPQLRAQGYAHLVEADKWRKEKDRLEPLKNQWIEANDAANEAAPAVREARNFFAQLEAARADIPQAQTQLQSLETLLPTLKQQLEQAEAEAQAQNAKVQQEWADYDADAEDYRQAIEDVLQRRGELNRQAIETQQQLAETEQWVERQTVALDAEARQVASLQQNLQQYRDELAAEIPAATGDELAELQAKLAQLDQSLQLASNKAAVLSAQQAALTQKRTLLTAQNEVILAEQRLLDAYISTPGDTGNLQQQLQDARAALAEAQRLAEQAEAASKALTAPLQQLQADLLAQNDEHLKQAKEHQAILKALLQATQLNANYTLQAAQKQQEVNTLEFNILQRLQTAAAAGYQEAKALLDVAQHNDMATAAEIYYRDYSDLASDKGNKCTPGLARPEDRPLADQYYRQMLEHRELQRRAKAQADAFRRVKETAQAQMGVLQQQQEIAAQQLSEINAKVAETQAQREAKEQELAIAQARLDGISRIREQTEQTFNQLVVLEQLNLAQAQLEQEIAQNRQADIDEAVRNRQERDRLELERRRLETQARIEQLRQLQVEDNLRQSLNQARGQLGLETLEGTEEPVELQSQLASLLENLKTLESEQPDLPADVKALLAEARGDIYLALQGKEASAIQENLLKTMGGLIGQIEQYKGEISRIDLEEQWDSQLLQEAEQDLQGASQQFLKELERSAALQGERDVIEPLYLEALNKVAYAEQAVDISEDMAKQAKEMLEQIIKQRIAERKARKKSFWNKILGIVSSVLSLVGTVLTFIPGANFIGLALGAIGGAISAVQAAINGDWMGAIFSAVMAGANFIGGSIGNALKAGQQMIMGMTKAVAQKVFTTIKAFQSLASGAFNGVRNLLSGDKIMGFLQIVGGLAGAATSGLQNAILNSPLGEFGYKVVDSLSKAPTLIYGGIKAIQSGDWVSGIGNIIKGIVSLAKTWTNDFNDGNESPGEKIANILENVSSAGIGVSKFITGGLEGLLEGLGDILEGLGDDIQKWVDKFVAGGNCDCPCPCPGEDLAESAGVLFDEMIALSPAEMARRLEGLAPELRLKVMDLLSSTLTTEEQIAVVSKLPEKQQAEVIPNLPQETLVKWRDRFLVEVEKKALDIESQLTLSTSAQIVIDGQAQSFGSTLPTQKKVFEEIVSKSFQGLGGETKEALLQMVTDPKQLATLLVSSAEGYVYGGYLAALHLNPATAGFALGTDAVLTGILIAQVLKPFYGAWQESGQIISEAQLTGQIDQHAVGLAIQELRYQNANFLAQNIPSLATGIVGRLSRLPQPQSKPQWSSQVPIPEHPDLPGGLTNLGYGATIRYTPNMVGPLPFTVRNSFRSGTYTAKTLEQPLTLYRVIPEGGNPTGSYWTRVKPQGNQQTIMDSALLPEWYTTPPTKVFKIEVPAGTRIYEGVVAPQTSGKAPHTLPGGGNQVYIPEINASWLKESWLIESNP